MRFAVGIEYDGSAFYGWQKQPHTEKTVQFVLEKALSRVADHPIQLYAAGRTDTGVHAIEQVAHFDSTALRQPHHWLLGANRHLPDEVKLIWVHPVSPDFHARFSALSRVYRYWIINRIARPAILNQKITWFYHPLDEKKMAAAGQYLLGEHDFTSYRSVHCQAPNPVRQLKRLAVQRFGDRILIEVQANGFLHHMVRNIVGVLLEIGCNKQKIHWARSVLEQKDRNQAGITAPADGLYFYRVHYEAKFTLPQRGLRSNDPF